MEEPVKIDVYGVVSKENKGQALEWLLLQGYYSKEFEAKKHLNEAIREERLIRLYESATLSEAEDVVVKYGWA